SGAPMTPNAVFGIGSVHKLVKWITAHLLIQDGELSLDDLVNDHVDRPSLPGVTIRDLMRHSSGMPDIVDVAEFMSAATSEQTREFTYDEMIGFLEASSGQNAFGSFEQGRLAGFEPGIDMSYSSFGPVVLGEVMRTITGRTMQDLVDERIIDRLGLDNTSHMGLEPDPPGLTPGYADAETPNPFFPDAASTLSFSTANGGAMHSTAEDLLEFISAIFGNADFLGPEAVSALTSDALTGAGMSSGLGVIQFDAWRSRGLWGHAGFGIRSHSTTVLHQPETGVSVVVLTNLNAELDQYETNLAVTESILDALSG
ncbi:MAG: beta-lactamase family protein, partial [Acidimicrobiia bacterium]|nr:beta-lactamase family protein [Acidimicrobiia bacterium]